MNIEMNKEQNLQLQRILMNALGKMCLGLWMS